MQRETAPDGRGANAGIEGARQQASTAAPSPGAINANGAAPSRNKLLEALLMVRAAPMYVADANGDIVYANPDFRRIARGAFGASLPEGRPLATPEPLRELFESMRGAGGEVVRREAVKIDGEQRHFRAHHFMLSGEQGESIGHGGMYIDVSDQVATEKRARHLETRFDDILRATSDWVWETDANLNLTHASNRIAQVLGTPPQLLVGKYMLSLGVFDNVPGPQRAMAEILKSHMPFRGRIFLMQSRNNKTRRIALSGVAVFDADSGRFAGYRGTGTDVTREHRAETRADSAQQDLEVALDDLKTQNLQLDIALDEARAGTKAQMEFLAMMSHELRTPLNAIMGFAEMSERQLFGPLNGTYAGYFHDIRQAANHLLEIINDLLDTARIESQQINVKPEPISAKSLIGEAKNLIAGRAEDKGIDIGAVYLDRDHRVMADPTRARQIFVNLLSNAINYTPEGGAVGLHCQETGDGAVTFTVWDTGIGIAPAEQEKIFERFYRVNGDPYRRREPGVGLGLAISRHVARLMDGDITLDSVLGKGSSFTLRLPMAAAEMAATDTADSA